MSNLIAAYGRATDLSGNEVVIVSGAVMYFYQAGSTTPLTVYTDSGLGTPRGISVTADSEGLFPQCWTSSSSVKIDVKDSSGNSLDGFPQDNFPTFPQSGQQASDVSFTPVTGNSGTTVQAAIASDTARINSMDNAGALPIATGGGGAYAIVPTYTIAAYAARQEFEFVANHASVGSGSDTLNVGGVGTVVIKKYFGSTTKADLDAGDIATGDVVRVKHDGTHFVLSGSTQELLLLDEDDMATDSATGVPSQQSTKAYVDGKNWTHLTAQATTSGTQFDFTIPAGAEEVEIGFDSVGVSGTDNIIVQLGDSGGIENTGYSATSGYDTGNATSTEGFSVATVGSGRQVSGLMRLSAGNTGKTRWGALHGGDADGIAISGGGAKTLSASLTTIRITRTGTDTFNAGEVTAKWR